MKKTLLALAISAVLVSAASAIDFSSQLHQLDGTAFTGPDGKPTELTLAKVATEALLATYPDEQNLSGAEKLKRFKLAEKVAGGKSVDLTADEIATLKTLIAKSYNPLVMGQAWKMLDPASVK